MSQEPKLRLSNGELTGIKKRASFFQLSDQETVESFTNAQLLHACQAFQTFLSRWDELGELSGDNFTAASLKFTKDYGINAEDSSVVECFDSFMKKEGIILKPINAKSEQEFPLSTLERK